MCEAHNYINFRLGSTTGSGEVVFKSQPVVSAEGPAVKGEGRIEFYVGSKLALTRLIKTNRSANLDCCGDFTRDEARQFRKQCRDWKSKGP